MILDPARTALILIDLQDNSREASAWPVEGYSKVVHNAGRLLAAARGSGIAPCHVALNYDPSAYDRGPAEMRAAPPADMSDMADPISDEVAPEGEEAVFLKAYRSAFFGTRLSTHLRTTGIDTLVIAGVWTDACIFATVIEAIRDGYRVVLVEDACGSGTSAMHEVAIVNLANRLYNGAVVSTDGAIASIVHQIPVCGWKYTKPIEFAYDLNSLAESYRTIAAASRR